MAEKKHHARVVVLKTGPQTVIDDYKKLMHLADYGKFIDKQHEVLLKLNLSWSMYFPSCSTEPWQLEGVLKTLVDDGYTKIHPVENRTVVTDVWKGARENKWLPILRTYNQKYEPLTEVKWVKFRPKTPTPALDAVFQGTHCIPEMFIGKSIIHLPTVKTHGHTTMTGSMKNAFGGLITARRHHSHKLIHEVLVDLLAIQKEIHPGIFTVMDGTVCGDGNCPRTMVPKIKNFILASDDSVAIDAISAKMMGYDPMRIRFIRLAHERGLGIGDPRQIDIIGEDISRVNFGFITGKSPVIFWDQVFRKGPLSFVEPLLFHTGLFKLCIWASAVYHDYLWYNVFGESIIRKFMKTEWGRLWEKY